MGELTDDQEHSSQGTNYDIMSKDDVGTYMLLGGLAGVVFTIMPVLKWVGLVEINSSRGFQLPDVLFFSAGLFVLCFTIYTMRQPYQLCLTESALVFDSSVGTTTIILTNIRSISTGRRFVWWEGADASVVHITHSLGKISVTKFPGADALFTRIISEHPHIEARMLNFLPDSEITVAQKIGEDPK